MYRKHFGMTRYPFAKDLDPADFFPSAAAQELEV
ncbi:MAG: AAA family ATPase, partial [Deltaproteobacteria bacterium]|nr:AAA family ATPase [Deltaproteobacteria bacterium]